MQYQTLLGVIPQERPVDAQTFVSCLSQTGGRGTPFALFQSEEEDIVTFSEDDLDELPLMKRIQSTFSFSLDPFVMFPSCAAWKRDSSPHSVSVG